MTSIFRFLALQKMVEEKKAEAEKMNMKVSQEPSMDLVHQVKQTPFSKEIQGA